MSSDFYGRGRMSESFGFVADWMQALNGKGDLADVLERLMRLVKADAALIARVSIVDSTIKYVARCDLQSGKVWPTPPRSFAKTLFGDWLPTARKGSIWKLSDVASCDYARGPIDADEIHRPVVEILACPLEKRNGDTDILELQYRHKPAQHDIDFVTMLIGTLSSCWHRRVSGIILKTLTLRRNITCINAAEHRDVPILDIENPAQLSRSEFRVCTLLKDGMTVNVIANALSIAPATVRAHLSSVFSKTGTCNQVELLHQLNRQKLPFVDVANG